MKNLILTTFLSFIMASFTFGSTAPEEKKCDKDEKKTETSVDSAAVEQKAASVKKATLPTDISSSKKQQIVNTKPKADEPLVEEKNQTDEESVLSFNFIYYMVQKFKFSDVMD